MALHCPIPCQEICSSPTSSKNGSTRVGELRDFHTTRSKAQGLVETYRDLLTLLLLLQLTLEFFLVKFGEVAHFGKLLAVESAFSESLDSLEKSNAQRIARRCTFRKGLVATKFFGALAVQYGLSRLSLLPFGVFLLLNRRTGATEAGFHDPDAPLRGRLLPEEPARCIHRPSISPHPRAAGALPALGARQADATQAAGLGPSCPRSPQWLWLHRPCPPTAPPRHGSILPRRVIPSNTGTP